MAATKLSEDIDRLLEQYLQLLDQYTDLRSQLSVAQSSIHQHIARANFFAERGIRYGEELYDARMQASRLCRITVPARGEGPPEHGTMASTTSFTLSTFALHEDELVGQASDGAQQRQTGWAGVERLKLDKLDSGDKINVKAADDTTKKCTTDSGTFTKARDEASTRAEVPNPLRMFGILKPPSLRLAQTVSIEAVSILIPAIISLDVQMKEVEIQIRRARKQKLKADRQEATKSENLKTSGDLSDKPPNAGDSLQQFLTVYILLRLQATQKDATVKINILRCMRHLEIAMDAVRKLMMPPLFPEILELLLPKLLALLDTIDMAEKEFNYLTLDQESTELMVQFKRSKTEVEGAYTMIMDLLAVYGKKVANDEWLVMSLCTIV